MPPKHNKIKALTRAGASLIIYTKLLPVKNMSGSKNAGIEKHPYFAGCERNKSWNEGIVYSLLTILDKKINIFTKKAENTNKRGCWSVSYL